MKRLYIHIGPAKTGTSTIQSFLAENHALLQAQGILYPQAPKVLQNSGHHPLAVHYRKDPGKPDWAHHYPLELLKENLRREIEKKKPQTVVLSSEIFWQAARLRQLKEDFPGFEIHVIAFLRRQDERMESSYAHMKRKARRRTMPPQQYGDRIGHGYNYNFILNRWANVFDRENMHVRVLERGRPDQRLPHVFSDIIGYRIGKDTFIPGTINERLNRHSLHFIEKFPAPGWFMRYFIAPALRDYSRKYPDPPERKYFFSPVERLQLIGKYAASNAKVARRFLRRPDGILFYDPLPEPDGPWQPYEGLPLGEALRMGGYIALFYLRQIILFMTNVRKRRRLMKYFGEKIAYQVFRLKS